MDLEDLARKAVAGDRRALEKLVSALKDDIYRLSMRMLSWPPDAEDATQDILIKVVTRLSQFRGESRLRTWVWSIATRHLLRFRKGVRESFVTFDLVAAMIAEGDGAAVPSPDDPETALLAEEVKLGCTGAMLLSLDREHRLAYILCEIFGLDGASAAKALGVSPASYRKRLERARTQLTAFIGSKCGLMSADNPCRCGRQIEVNVRRGAVDPARLFFAEHPVERGAISAPKDRLREAREIERAAEIFRSHPHYASPDRVVDAVRALIDSGRYRLFDA